MEIEEILEKLEELKTTKWWLQESIQLNSIESTHDSRNLVSEGHIRIAAIKESLHLMVDEL